MESYAEAYQVFGKRVLLDPAPQALEGLGGALSGLGRSQEAVSKYEAALREDAGFDECMYNLAWELSDERPDDAVSLLLAAIEIDSAVANYHGLLGRILRDLGQSDAAETSIRNAIALDPRLVAAQVDLAEILVNRGQVLAAQQTYDRALRLDPHSALVRHSYGRFQERLGQRDAALASFKRAVAVEPMDPNALYHLGRFYADEGDLVEAKRWLSEYMTLCPDDEEVRSMLSRLSRGEEESE